MLHSARLQISTGFGTFGPAFVYDLTAKEALKRALATGLLTNIERIGKEADEKNEGPLRLSHIPQFWDGGTNSSAQWSFNSGDGLDYFGDYPDPFGHGAGLGWEDNNPNNIVLLQPHAPNLIGANQPWSYMGYICKPDSTQTIKLFTLRFPSQYQFQIRDGRAEIMRLNFYAQSPGSPADSWNQSDEDTLNGLLALGSLTDEQQTQVNNLLATLYTDYQKLSLGSSEAFYNQPFKLTFIPEPCGRLHIELEGHGTQVVENSAIVAARTAGQPVWATPMWQAGSPSIRSYGGAFFWQLGAPLFAQTGSIQLNILKTYWSEDTDISFNTSADTSLPGTGCTFAKLGGGDDDPWFSLVLTLTGNGAYTPFLYSCQALTDAGDRSGNTADILYDSDTVSDAGGKVITEVVPSFDGFDRKRQVTVTLRDVNGAAFVGAGYNYSVFENCLATLTVDGYAVITNGLIVSSKRTDQRAATANQAPSEVTLPGSAVELTIADLWTVLGESELLADPIGDGEPLGTYLRRILHLGGILYSEMSGISTSAGRNLPAAAFGEKPCVRPALRSTIAAWVRDLVDRYGMGLYLYQDASGIWNLAPLPDSLASYGGYPANFTSSAAANRSQTYPGRLAMLNKLELYRDYSDFYNDFHVYGATGPDGSPLRADYTDMLSAGARNLPNVLNWLGRIKTYHSERDEALRTIDDCNWVVRSLLAIHSRNPMFYDMETYYHPQMQPRDLITIDGRSAEVVRVLSASAANDSMGVTVRVLT